MKNLTNKIWVTFQRKGFHLYPNAPEKVAYLATRHRHLFKFKVTAEVFHEEREIEFHMFQTEIEELYDTEALEASGKSCETMANDLLSVLTTRYNNRRFEVEVSEDGECGSIVSMF
jgi:hypothetical protein